MSNMDIINKVNETILNSLESGNIPWIKPWNHSSISALIPTNFQTKKNYRGINIWLLMLEQEAKGFTSNYWIGFGQCQKLKGRVKAGEKGTNIILWQFSDIEEKDENGNKILDENGKVKTRKIGYLKTLKVFNIQQCEGLNIPAFKPTTTIERDNSCDNLINTYKTRENIEIKHSEQNRAYYSIGLDYIQLPLMEQFKSKQGYYATTFHEIAHSTGSEKRLAREFGLSFGNDLYSFEELVAELTSAYICSSNGISNEETIENSIAYIQSWSKKLKDNPNWFFSAASKAQKALDFILTGSKGYEAIEE